MPDIQFTNLPYELVGPKEISAKQLLLWPNNPRLKINTFKEFKYTDAELINPKIQKNIYNELIKTEHNVKDITNSMRRRGFMREKALIVMEVEGNKYLVLEGNRRLTAVLTILKDGIKNTNLLLQNIPCFIFIHTKKEIPLNNAISLLVAEQHIKEKKPHTKIQQANMLYDVYMGFLQQKFGRINFSRNDESIKKCADFFDLTVKEIEKELSAFRIYEQLCNYSENPIPHGIRERLTWIFDNPRHFTKQFGYNESYFQLNNAGLERYYEIFVKPHCAVSNPTAFKKFIIILRHANDTNNSNWIEHLRDKPGDLEYIVEQIKLVKTENKFFSVLQKIKRNLISLKVHEFKGSKEEVNEIDRIVHLVHKKLSKLKSNPAVLTLESDMQDLPPKFLDNENMEEEEEPSESNSDIIINPPVHDTITIPHDAFNRDESSLVLDQPDGIKRFLKFQKGHEHPCSVVFKINDYQLEVNKIYTIKITEAAFKPTLIEKITIENEAHYVESDDDWNLEHSFKHEKTTDYLFYVICENKEKVGMFRIGIYSG